MRSSRILTAGFDGMSEHLALPLYAVKIRAKAEDSGPDNPVIGCCAYDNEGEYLTRALPESVCEELVKICNAYYCEKQLVSKQVEYGRLLFSAEIPGSPMPKPESQVVAVDKNDKPYVCDSPIYLKYLTEFAEKCTIRHATAYKPLPLDERCQVRCLYYCDNKASKSLPAHLEATLDCLVYAGILKSKSHQIVNNTDGSRIYPDMDNPRTIIWIRRWSDK